AKPKMWTEQVSGPIGADDRELAVPLTFEALAVCDRRVRAHSCALGLVLAVKLLRSTTWPVTTCDAHGLLGDTIPPRKVAGALSGQMAGSAARHDCIWLNLRHTMKASRANARRPVMDDFQRILLLIGRLNYTWTNTESLLIHLMAGLAKVD